MPDLDLLRAELRELRDVIEPFYGDPGTRTEGIFALGFAYAKAQAALAILGAGEKTVDTAKVARGGILYERGVMPCSDQPRTTTNISAMPPHLSRGVEPDA